MMIVFFVGINVASVLTDFAQTPWQAAAITLVGMLGL
jgi:hypothetical protein